MDEKELQPPVSGDAEGGKGGDSNTHPSSYFKRGCATCIDYLKLRFNTKFVLDDEDSPFKKLFGIMHLNPKEGNVDKSFNNYEHTLKLAPGIMLWYGGKKTQTADGKDTCILELRGSSCREFEDIVYSHYKMEGEITPRDKVLKEAWLQLLEECKALGGICTRLDIPTDDFSGDITVDEIREKVAKREYSTKLRRLDAASSNDEIEWPEDPELEKTRMVRDSKLSGYSATFGGRKSSQLCIYDKRAERMASGIDPGVDSWIRFEVRYYHDNANHALDKLIQAFREDNVSGHIVGCLAQMFEFKETITMDGANKYKNKTWSKWEALIKDATPSEAFATSPKLMSIETNGAWIVNGAAKSFGRLLFAIGSNFSEMGTVFLMRFIEKATKADLQIINQWLKQRGRPEIESLETLRDLAYSRPDLCQEFREDVVILLLTHHNEDSTSIIRKKEINDG